MLGTESSSALVNPTTDSIPAELLEGGEILSQLTLAKDAHIKGGAAAYDDGDGFWLGSFNRSLTDYRFFIGSSAGNKMTYANGVLTVTGSITATTGAIGGFEIGADYIRDVADTFGLASTVTVGDDIRFWAGAPFASRASAPFRVTEAGILVAGNSNDFISYDGTIIRVFGKVAAQQSYTTGHAIDLGDSVARETGAVYRTRVNDFASAGTATTLTINPYSPGTTNKNGRFISISSTIKLLITATGNTTNDITASRIVCSPSSSSVTSATATVAVNTTADITVDADGCALTSTTAFVVYTNAGGGGIFAKVLSDLDTTVTANVEVTVAAACNDRCAVVPVSATEVIVIYTNATDDVVATSCTISGTTVTVGATQTLLADANTYRVRWAERFESTTAYCVALFDVTNTISYALAFTYSAGVYAIGSATTVVTTTTIPSLASMSDSSILFVGSGRSYGITRSGTTLTVGANTAVGTGNFMYVTRMGKGNAAVFWRQAAADIRYQVMDLNGTTVTLLGSAGTVDTTGGDDFLPMGVRLSPTRALVFRDGTISTDEKVAVIDWSSNFSSTIGIAATNAASGASLLVVQSGESDDITGGVDGATAYVDAGGGLTSSALGGSVKMGVFTGATTIVVQV